MSSAPSEHAYSTDDPEAVAAYRRAGVDRDAHGPRIAADLKTLGAGPRVYLRRAAIAGPDSITAVEQSGGLIPDGWRLTGRLLVPRRGKPGEPAREWLAAHQPVDVRHVMVGHGLPRSTWLPSDRGWRIVTPKLFEHDGTLWACYEGEPGTSDSGFDTAKCTWTPRKLSEFYTAWEAFEAVGKASGEVLADA